MGPLKRVGHWAHSRTAEKGISKDVSSKGKGVEVVRQRFGFLG